ncbi:mucin-2 isoform X2 [Wyeomyia smithii]|uniref:mucin-2 isoform X2 n=1 Tax=Wyeomyia smithii TaxID=174621 RepID=UPI002467DF0F|nr:mucin-2 isoform X2 [Wyeomyia smithii]
MGLRLEILFCVLINGLLVHSAVYISGNGPVYNPNGNAGVQAVVPTQANNPGYLVTQTVYGFLDFTTTIGNTVMIFSPQSAAAAITEPPKTTPAPPPVIETSPPPTPSTTSAVALAEEIKPSKTVILPVTAKEKVSVVQVIAETPKPFIVKPNVPVKFVQKAITPAKAKPVSKPKAKIAIVEVTPIKAEPEPEIEEKKLEEPVKVQVVKPQAPIIKVVATKVEVTTEKEIVTPEPQVQVVHEEEPEKEDEEETVQEERQEPDSEEEPEEVEETKVEEPTETEHVEEDTQNEDDEQQEQHDEKEKEMEEEKVELPKPRETVEEPTIEAEQKEHSPIMFSAISEEKETAPQEATEPEEEDEEEEDEPAPVLQIGNNIAPEPEYDFLSRQPSEFVEETYRVVNLKPTPTTSAASTAAPKAKGKRGQGNKNARPTGLVTKLGGTVVNDGATTVHETSVIGTYISGKYAQVLQSTSHVFQGNSAAAAAPAEGQPRRAPGPKVSPSSTLRILKTAAPNPNKTPRYNPEAAAIVTPSPSSQHVLEDTELPLENLFANQPSSSLVRPSRRLSGPGVNLNGGNFKNRLKNRISKEESNDLQDRSDTEPEPVGPPVAPTASFGNGKKTNRYRNTQTVKPNHVGKNVEVATVSVFSEPSSTTPAYANRRNKASRNSFKPSLTYSSIPAASSASYSSQQEANRRSFKPNLRPTPPEGESSTTSTSLYKFKLNRSPGRWQYKSPPKPTVNIRKQSPKPKDPAENLATAPVYDSSVQNNDISQNPDHQENIDNDADLDQSGSVNGNVLNEAENDNQIERRYPIETIKVEISTPADFKDTYYEIATIKSPYTFQVGTVKNTRYITVTSTFEKTLEQETATITPSLTEPLTENILATTTHLDKESNLLDSSIATLPPITLTGETETPPLETLTETFSTTQEMLKTHILPVIRDGTDTTSYTLIQTYHVTRLVTATKTLPPMELYHFVPSKTLNEFNSRLDEAGSELHLELEFGDNNEDDDDKLRLPSDLDLSNIGSDFDLSEVDKTNIPVNIRPKKKVANHKEVNKVTTEAPVTTPSLTPDQLQQLALLRLLNPAAAAQIPSVITSSKPVVKLETVYESHVLPIINGQNTILSTISRPIGTITKTNYEVVTTTLPALPIPPIPQLNPFQQPQVTLQSTPVVTQTVVTETNSKVLKLTFGAKTAYTTLYSTTVVPTQLTTYVTQSVPIQPTAAFPGYFPAPYAPFPYVG